MYLETFVIWILRYANLDPAHFISALELAWQAALQKTKVKLQWLTDIDILLMIEKGVRGVNVMLLIDMWRLVKDTWKIMIKIKNHHFWSNGM